MKGNSWDLERRIERRGPLRQRGCHLSIYDFRKRSECGSVWVGQEDADACSPEPDWKLTGGAEGKR